MSRANLLHAFDTGLYVAFYTRLYRQGREDSKIDRFAQLVATTTDSDVINSRSVQEEE